MRLDGIFPPICTPFLLNGEFSPVHLRANIEKWNKTGVSGYVPTGSTGESVFLTREETLKVWEGSARSCRSGQAAHRRHGRRVGARNHRADQAGG